MKEKGKHLPLWLMITICVIIISGISILLIKLFGDKSWFPALASLIVVSAIAAAGCVAYHQLRVIQGTERAAVLSSLDNCWYGYLADSRSEFLKFKNSLKSASDSPEYRQEIIGKLKTMKKDSPDTYRKLVGMLDFYEALGYFSSVEYILPRDVIQLYGPSINEYDKMFREYILEYQRTDQDPSIYENFIWLTNELKKQYD